MDVEPLRLIAGETAGDALKRLADRVQMVQSFAQAEVGEVVGAELVAQKRRELFILLEEGVLEVGAEDMMAMLDLIDDGGELAAHPAVKAGSEDRGNLVGGESPQAQFAAALEQFVDGKVALEDEVAAIFDLGDGIEARQVELLTLLGGELRSQEEGPVVELFADDFRAQSVGGSLQRSDIVDRKEGIVVLAEADLRAVEFLLDEAVAIEIVSRLEGEERGHTHHHGAKSFIADVEIVVGEAAALADEDAVMRVLGGIFRHADAEGRPLLHALEDEIDAVGVLVHHSA